MSLILAGSISLDSTFKQIQKTVAINWKEKQNICFVLRGLDEFNVETEEVRSRCEDDMCWSKRNRRGKIALHALPHFSVGASMSAST